MKDRIRITADNAQRLVDEIDIGLIPEWLTATQMSSTFRISRSQVNVWGQQGAVRSRGTGKFFGSREQLEYNVTDLIFERVRRRSLKERRVEYRDGQLYIECADDDCRQMKHADRDFYRNPGSGLSVSTRCKECHNKRGKEWDRANIDKRNAKKMRAARKAAAAARAASKWQPRKLYPAKPVVEAVEASFKDTPVADIERMADIPVYAYRSIIRSAEKGGEVRVSSIVALLEGLGLTDEWAIISAELDKDRPRWHPKHAYCARCYRVSVPHHAKGLCRTCHRNRNVPGWTPPVAEKGQGWSLRHPSCVECKTTERPHHAHGMCDRCLQRKRFFERRAAEASEVGSGHGNHRLVQQQAEASTDSSIGRGHQGRIASNA